MDDATGIMRAGPASIPEPQSPAAWPTPCPAQRGSQILLGTALPCHARSCPLKVHPPPTSVSAFLLQPFKVLSDWLLTCMGM